MAVYTLSGHSNHILAASCSRLEDGTDVAITVSCDHTARTWDLATGALRHLLDPGQQASRWKPHAGVADKCAVACARLRDGTEVVAITAMESSVHIWRLADGSSVLHIDDHRHPVNSVNFVSTSDGREIIMVVSHSTTAWDLRDGSRTRHNFTDHAFVATKVAVWGSTCATYITVDENVDMALVGDDDGTVRAWNLADCDQPHALLRSHTATIEAVATHKTADGNIIVATASSDRTAKVWRLHVQPEKTDRIGHTSNVWSVACTRLRNNSVIAASAADHDAAVQIRNLADGTLCQVLQHDDSVVTDVACTRLSDGTDIAVTLAYGVLNRDNTVWVWDLADGRLRHKLTGHKKRPLSIAFSRLPDGLDLAVTTSDDYTARVWDLGAGTPHKVLRGHKLWVWSVVCTQLADGVQVAVTTSSDGTARVWNIVDGRQMHILPQEGVVWDVACTRLSDGTDIAITVGTDGPAQIWDIGRGSLRHSLPGHSSPVTGVACAKLRDNTNVAVTTSKDGTARIWNLDDGDFLHAIESKARKPICSRLSDGTPISVLAGDKSLLVIDLELLRIQEVALPAKAGPAAILSGCNTLVASFGWELARLDQIRA
ncbi:MAG TPA: hypothetical protein DGG94_04955 [Micromonosporaceae bacterium]|nr:hypothetical protein [Micromonosporaceae bacterium]